MSEDSTTPCSLWAAAPQSNLPSSTGVAHHVAPWGVACESGKFPEPLSIPFPSKMGCFDVEETAVYWTLAVTQATAPSPLLTGPAGTLS